MLCDAPGVRTLCSSAWHTQAAYLQRTRLAVSPSELRGVPCGSQIRASLSCRTFFFVNPPRLLISVRLKQGTAERVSSKVSKRELHELAPKGIEWQNRTRNTVRKQVQLSTSCFTLDSLLKLTGKRSFGVASVREECGSPDAAKLRMIGLFTSQGTPNGQSLTNYSFTRVDEAILPPPCRSGYRASSAPFPARARTTRTSNSASACTGSK